MISSATPAHPAANKCPVRPAFHPQPVHPPARRRGRTDHFPGGFIQKHVQIVAQQVNIKQLFGDRVAHVLQPDWLARQHAGQQAFEPAEVGGQC